MCERPLLGVGPTCNYTNANTCDNLGIAQPDGSCQCKDPEVGVGPRCEFNNRDTCSNAGVAQFSGDCLCNDPAVGVGPSCQHNNRDTCSNAGVAQADGSCECQTPDEGVGPACEFTSQKTCSGAGIAQPDGSCACFGPVTGQGPSCSEYSNARTCQNLGVLNYTSVLANPNKTDTGPRWCDWRETIQHMFITDPTAKVGAGMIQCHSLVEGRCEGQEFQACSQRCRPDCLKELVFAKREEDNNMPLTNVRPATTQAITTDQSTEDARGLWFLSTSSVAPDFASDDDATGTYTSTNALADISTTYAPSTTSADGSTTNVPTTDWGWWSGSGGGRQRRDENVGVDNKPPQPNAEKYYSYNHADD